MAQLREKDCYCNLLGKSRDAAKCVAMLWTGPTTKNDPTPNVNSADIKKPRSKQSGKLGRGAFSNRNPFNQAVLPSSL